MSTEPAIALASKSPGYDLEFLVLGSLSENAGLTNGLSREYLIQFRRSVML